MSSILIIEDDKALAQLLKKVLEKAGFSVTVVHTAQACKALDDQLDPDLIICDVMLPDGDGFTLSQWLKNRFTAPFLFLTALDSDDDHIHGLDRGAVDYIIKPVKPELLLARVKTNLRKAVALNPQVMHLNDLKLDTQRHEAFYRNANLQVNPDEYAILHMLVEQDPEPVSRDTLFLEIIGREYDGIDRAIDLKVSRLRKKLHTNGAQVDIKSIRGKGYVLAAKEP